MVSIDTYGIVADEIPDISPNPVFVCEMDTAMQEDSFDSVGLSGVTG